MSDPAKLCRLPDDILRAPVAFVPPSGLIVLVRSVQPDTWDSAPR